MPNQLLMWCFTVTSNDTSEGTPDVATLDIYVSLTGIHHKSSLSQVQTTHSLTAIFLTSCKSMVDAVNTLDVNFASLPAQDVNATNADDDDTAGFTLDKTTLATTEAGGCRTRLR
jgi:hypothetical protein